MFRTITSVFLLPLIYYTFSKRLYLDCLSGIISMTASIVFHYVEDRQLVELFDLDWWNWLLVDTVAATLLMCTITTHIAKIDGEIRTILLVFVLMVELVLDLHFIANYDDQAMALENVGVAVICLLTVVVRREHIRSSRLQCLAIGLLYLVSASFLVFFQNMRIEIMHSLWHVGAFGASFLVYYCEENGCNPQPDDDETNTAQESSTATTAPQNTIETNVGVASKKTNRDSTAITLAGSSLFMEPNPDTEGADETEDNTESEVELGGLGTGEYAEEDADEVTIEFLYELDV